MSPRNLGTFAALNPVAWQLEAMRLANRNETNVAPRNNHPASKVHRRIGRPTALLAAIAGLVALPWIF